MEDFEDPVAQAVLRPDQEVCPRWEGAVEAGFEGLDPVRAFQKNREVGRGGRALLRGEKAIGEEDDPLDGGVVPVDTENGTGDGTVSGGIGHRVSDLLSEAVGEGFGDQNPLSGHEGPQNRRGRGRSDQGQGDVPVEAVQIGVGEVGGFRPDSGRQEGIPGHPVHKRILGDRPGKGVREGLRAVGGEAGGRLDIDVGLEVLVDPEIQGLLEGGDHDHDADHHAQACHHSRDRDPGPADRRGEGGQGKGMDRVCQKGRDSPEERGKGSQKGRNQEASGEDRKKGGGIAPPGETVEGGEAGQGKAQEAKEDEEAPEGLLPACLALFLLDAGEPQDRGNPGRLPKGARDGEERDPHREKKGQEVFGQGGSDRKKVRGKKHRGDRPLDGLEGDPGQELPPQETEQPSQKAEPGCLEGQEHPDLPHRYPQKAERCDFGAPPDHKEEKRVADEKIGHQEGHEGEGHEIGAVGREHRVVLVFPGLP